MRWLFSGLTAALLTLTLTPQAAQAADSAGTEDHFQVATSTSNSWPDRSVTVECPPGQIVWGFGGATIGGTGRVALTEIMPNAALTSVTVTARARAGWVGAFSVQAAATCWAPGNVGLQRIVGQGGAFAHAECPGQQVVYASGFQVKAMLGDAYTSRVEPDADQSGLTVVAGGAEPIGLGTKAVALCGFANTAQIYIHRRTEATVPVDAGPSTTAAAPPMEHSPTGWSWVTGAGAGSTASGMFIDALGPVPALDQGLARMSRVSSIPAGLRVADDEGDDDGDVTVWGTCIGAWY